MLNGLKINEIFYSIQGESTSVGFPTVFIRTTGCNLRCNYCDTQYSYYEGLYKSLNDILAEVDKHSAQYVCITGGEPLLQKKSVMELIELLLVRNYKVSLETSGGKSIEGIDGRVNIVLDVKTPDSGAENSFLLENLTHAPNNTEFKFVICSEKDFVWAEEFCKNYGLFSKYTVLYSPSFGQIPEKFLADLILKFKSKARLQLQIHKYIWSPDTRGV